MALIWGYDIHPQIEIIQTGNNFFQFRAIANNFGFLRFYQIRHFGLSGQHGVQIFTADVERGVGSDSNLLIVFYVQIMPDDLVMQLHRF